MTRKSKILTIFLSLLAVVVLLVVLSSTLFAVSSVSVQFHSTKNVLASVDETEIAKSSNIKTGSNVFFLSKTKAKQKIEQTYPYIKVLNIETKFPNKIIIHAIERDKVFAFQKDDKYYVTDSDLKVLDIVDGVYLSEKTNPIKVSFDGEVCNKGEFLSVSKKFLPLKTLEEANYQNYEKEQSSSALSDFLSYYQEIEVFDEKIVLKTFLGVKVNIYSPQTKIQEKLKMVSIKFDELSESQKSTGTINIFESENKVIGSYINE